MEDSLSKAAKSKYGSEYDIQAKIDIKTGELSMNRCRTVDENIGIIYLKFYLKMLQQLNQEFKLGKLFMILYLL